jgi:hypothetical protein
LDDLVAGTKNLAIGVKFAESRNRSLFGNAQESLHAFRELSLIQERLKNEPPGKTFAVAGVLTATQGNTSFSA